MPGVAGNADCVLHLRYTARDGGRRLADAAGASLRENLNELMATADGDGGFTRLVSLRHEYPGWASLVAATGTRSVRVDLADRFPLLLRRCALQVDRIEILFQGRTGFGAPPFADARAELRKASFDGAALAKLDGWQGRRDVLSFTIENMAADPRAVTWGLSLAECDNEAVAAIADILLVCHYTASVV